MTARIPPALPAALQRRVIRAACRRPQLPQAVASSSAPAAVRHFTSTPVAARFPTPDRREVSAFPAPPAALTALLSRLSLSPSPALHDALLACLTHPTYYLSQRRSGRNANEGDASEEAESSSSASIEAEQRAAAAALIESNEVLSTLGNSLLGLFTTEHLSHLYPQLPSEALQSAVTVYAGPASCVAVARELGISTSGRPKQRDGRRGHGVVEGGVVVRWTKMEFAYKKRRPTTVSAIDAAAAEAGEALESAEAAADASNGKISFDEVLASVVRAFIGLIYQEKGMTAARDFVHAHFLSRHLDMTQLFSFRNPKHILSSVVAKHLASAGVMPGDGSGNVEARLLTSTGVNSQAPLYLVGLFLPSGLKLAEGHGSSMKMAEHRAAVNALHSLFLVRSDVMAAGTPSSAQSTAAVLPSEAFESWAYAAGKVGAGSRFNGNPSAGGDVVAESSRRSVRR